VFLARGVRLATRPVRCRSSVATEQDIWVPELTPAGTGRRYFKLFISHTSKHKREVGLLSLSLSLHGIAGFVAHDSIRPSLEWQDVIVRALGECEALAAYLTEDFHVSEWTDQEVGAVIGRRGLVLALKVEVDPYGFMGRYQAMNAGGLDRDLLARQIADVLIANPLTRNAMAEAVVDDFAHTTTCFRYRELR
jgi:TIR domain